MKRILMNGVGLALLIGVVGCGSAGIEEGAPKGDMKIAPIPSDMTKPGGFGAAAASKSAAKNSEQAKTEAGKAPAPTPESK